MKLTAEMLPIVNFCLSQDPALAKTLEDSIKIAQGYIGNLGAAAEIALRGEPTTPPTPKRPVEAEPDPNVAKIVKVLRSLASEATKETVRSGASLAAPDFDRAWSSGLKSGQIKHNGKRGAGARYSAA